MWSATFGAKIWHGDKAIFHYHIWNVKCNEEVLLQKYMYYNLEEITRRMMRQVSGSTMPHITKSGMEKLKIGLPPIEEQKVFIRELDEIEGTISDVKRNIQSFSEFKKNLANKVF
jgi:type I restriction enzyme S subunit